MKTLLLGISASLLTLSLNGQLAITGFQRDGTLTWTNPFSNAVYRVESTPRYGPPPPVIWATVTNVGPIEVSNQQVTVQVAPPGTRRSEFFRVVWAAAPPAQPVGIWEYQGFDPGGGLVVTGVVSIAEADPMTGSCAFRAVGADAQRRHPVGSGALTNGVIIGSNRVEIPLPSEISHPFQDFRLSGQMTLDEYWGRWSYADVGIGIPGQPTPTITVSGRFAARRVEQ